MYVIDYSEWRLLLGSLWALQPTHFYKAPPPAPKSFVSTCTKFQKTANLVRVLFRKIGHQIAYTFTNDLPGFTSKKNWILNKRIFYSFTFRIKDPKLVCVLSKPQKTTHTFKHILPSMKELIVRLPLLHCRMQVGCKFSADFDTFLQTQLS